MPPAPPPAPNVAAPKDNKEGSTALLVVSTLLRLLLVSPARIWLVYVYKPQETPSQTRIIHPCPWFYARSTLLRQEIQSNLHTIVHQRKGNPHILRDSHTHATTPRREIESPREARYVPSSPRTAVSPSLCPARTKNTSTARHDFVRLSATRHRGSDRPSGYHKKSRPLDKVLETQQWQCKHERALRHKTGSRPNPHVLFRPPLKFPVRFPTKLQTAGTGNASLPKKSEK